MLLKPKLLEKKKGHLRKNTTTTNVNAKKFQAKENGLVA